MFSNSTMMEHEVEQNGVMVDFFEIFVVFNVCLTCPQTF